MRMNPYSRNLEEEVFAAEPVKLVLLLLRAARQAVEEARRALHARQIRDRVSATTRALERIAELNRCLDREGGGDFSARLASLYEYMIFSLNEAIANQTEAPLAEVSALLAPIIEAWTEVEASEMTGGIPPRGCTLAELSCHG